MKVFSMMRPSILLCLDLFNWEMSFLMEVICSLIVVAQGVPERMPGMDIIPNQDTLVSFIDKRNIFPLYAVVGHIKRT